MQLLLICTSSQGSLNQPRLAHQGVALLNGSVMAIGGSTVPQQDGTWNESTLLNSCEVLVDGVWYNSSNLTHPRANFQVGRHDLFVLSCVPLSPHKSECSP